MYENKTNTCVMIFEFIIYGENLHVSATFFVAIFSEVLYEGYVIKLTTDV